MLIHFIANNPLEPSFPRRRESSKINRPRGGQNLGLGANGLFGFIAQASTIPLRQTAALKV